MKAVLISVKPKWCELIAKGEKTVEVRKTRPKLETPFKCYIYETKGKVEKPREDEDGYIYQEGRSAVIGEFVCDKVDCYILAGDRRSLVNYCFISDRGVYRPIDYSPLCLSESEFASYAGRKPLYGWHISDLMIYDKPKKIAEFKRWNRTEDNSPCAHTKWLYEPCETCAECNLKRPPQSWCYIEAREDGE